jgi:uncharacterized protein YggE
MVYNLLREYSSRLGSIKPVIGIKEIIMSKFYFLTILVFVFSSSSFAESELETQRQIRVSGVGSVVSTPDLFSFVVHIEEKGKLAGDLNKVIVAKTLNVVTTLTEIGVPKKSIQSLQVRFNPWIEYKREGNQQKGFILSRKISVILDELSQYDQAIDALLKIGITRIDGFNSTSSKSAEHYQTALHQALLSAKSRAEKMAQTLGLKLDKVMTISEQTSSHAAPVQMDALRSAKTSSYQPGEMATQARVDVIFSLSDSN